MPVSPRQPPPDQAQQLRQLAQPTSSRMASVSPRVVMLSEFPAVVGGFSLAKWMASPDGQSQFRTLLIDLSPVGSRLPDSLGIAHRDLWPLWQASPHGPHLADWNPASEPNRNLSLDVVAQTDTNAPTAEQMQRIYEQLPGQILLYSYRSEQIKRAAR